MQDWDDSELMARDADVVDRTDMMDGLKAVPGMAWRLELFHEGHSSFDLDAMSDDAWLAVGWSNKQAFQKILKSSSAQKLGHPQKSNHPQADHASVASIVVVNAGSMLVEPDLSSYKKHYTVSSSSKAS